MRHCPGIDPGIARTVNDVIGQYFDRLSFLELQGVLPAEPLPGTLLLNPTREPRQPPGPLANDVYFIGLHVNIISVWR